MNNFKMQYNGDDFALMPEDVCKNWTIIKSENDFDFFIEWSNCIDENGEVVTPALARVDLLSFCVDLSKTDKSIFLPCESLCDQFTIGENGINAVITTDNKDLYKVVNILLTAIKKMEV